MPTTQDEAAKIVEICGRHGVQGKTLFLLARDLRDEVGSKSSNSSVRETMEMLFAIAYNDSPQCPEAQSLKVVIATPVATPRVIATPPIRWGWLLLWLLIWTIHATMVVGTMASALVAPFLTTWNLAFPIIFCVVWVGSSPVDCIITRWENRVRVKLGWPTIRMFIGHYFVWPVRSIWRSWKRVLSDSDPHFS